MPRLLLLVSALLLATVSIARAAEPIDQPALVSFGISYMNFDKTEARRQTPDFRLEYRWGLSMLPLISDYFKKWDPYIQFHPFVGGEATALAQGYAVGGWAMDWYATKHVVFTWSEGAGLYENGHAVRLGSFVEFRSQAELGWRFDNNVRLTGEISHISNAKITRFNPGAEIAGVYLHIPFENMFGKSPQ